MKRLLTGLAALFVVVAVGVVGASTALATKPPEHKVTICHATPPDTAAQGWHSITVDVASVGYQHSGHQDQHDADIIPAWSYTDSDGNTVSYAGKNLGDLGAFGLPGVNGADVLANGCVPEQPPGDTVVSPVPPTTAPAACEMPESLTIPQQPEGVVAMVGDKKITVPATYSGPAENVTVVFSPAEGFVFPEGTQTEYTYDLAGPDNTQCENSSNPPKHEHRTPANAAGVSNMQLVADSGSRVQGG